MAVFLVLVWCSSALGGKLSTRFRGENGPVGSSSEPRVLVGNFPELVFILSGRLGKSGFRPVELPGDSVLERLVDAVMVVVAHPFGDTGLKLDQIAVAAHVDALILQAAPQPFDEHVVQPAAAAVHADSRPHAFQGVDPVVAGELATLVGVEDFGHGARRGDSLLQSLQAKRRIERVGEFPGKHRPGVPVHDGHQIRMSTLHRNVGDVGAPCLIRPVDFQFLEQIRVFAMRGVGHARPSLRGDGLDAGLLHEPPQALAVDPQPQFVEFHLELALPVERPAHVQPVECGKHRLVA